MGVLFRNAEAIETLRKVDTLLIDKTGTLTRGRPEVITLLPAAGVSEETLLALVAGLEKGSEHPLARAILECAEQRQVSPAEVSEFAVIPGKGVTGNVADGPVALGNQSLMEELSVPLDSWSVTAASMRQKGQTVVFASSGPAITGIIGIADAIRESTPAALLSLKKAGLRIIMVTGDNPDTARAVGETLGLADIEAGVLPAQKVEIVRREQAAGRIVAMAGDGINDAPALALADVGIAMGTGTDVAMESADITLVKGDLRALEKARKLSEAAMRNIRQNLLFAFLYNALGVPVAAGVLYPLTGILLSPMIAAGAMSLSSVSVISNALRLRKASL
jgi:Cu+-exporting ATPase